ncbi:divergent polysaccharide deacetylase family protein [bacterium]|nr:divergent polysaccharide deacetylase family protein [bacterium]
MAQIYHRKKRSKKPPSKVWRLVVGIALGTIIITALVFLLYSVFHQKTSETSPSPVIDTINSNDEANESIAEYTVKNGSKQPTTEDNLDEALFNALAKLGAPKSELHIRKAGQIEGLGRDLIEIRAEISRAFPMSMANHLIQSSWRSAGGEIIDCIENKLGRQITIQAGFGGIITRRIKVSREQKEPLKGKVCLVIDDFGALPLNKIKGFLDLGIPYTASVMPFEEFTPEVYAALVAKEIEIIVHMPMEPDAYPKVDPGEKAIFVDLPEKEIIKRIETAIANLPKAVGINNHMGSRATADKKTMCIVGKALKNSGLFYIDSRTSVYTCAEEEIGKCGIPVTSQDGNIDVVDDTSAIARKFIDLALRSRETKDGMLIVGHARPNTIIAIKRILPSLDKWGIEFVSASEMVSHRSIEE